MKEKKEEFIRYSIILFHAYVGLELFPNYVWLAIATHNPGQNTRPAVQPDLSFHRHPNSTITAPIRPKHTSIHPPKPTAQ